MLRGPRFQSMGVVVVTTVDDGPSDIQLRYIMFNETVRRSVDGSRPAVKSSSGP